MTSEEFCPRITVLLEHTTVHGLNHVYYANTRRSKLIWLFLFLLGVGGFVFNLFFIVQRYLSNPILRSHLVNHDQFIWPDLTFCNPTAPFALHQHPSARLHWDNTILKSKEYAKMLGSKSRLFRIIQEFNTSDFELEEISVSLSTIDPLKLQVDNFHNHILFYGYTNQHSGIYLVKEYSNSGIEVDNKDLNQLFTTQYVQIRNNIPCHTFQINRSQTLNTEDINSLVFLIRFNYPSYLLINSSYIFRSIFLFANERDQLPQKDGILMLPGFNNELILTQTRNIHNSNKRNCRNNVFKVDVYDALLTSTNVYEGDYEDCRKVESQRWYLHYCHCYNPFLPIYKTSDEFPKLCLNASIYSLTEMLMNAECMAQIYDQYHKYGAFDDIEERACGKYRDVKCNELTYNIDQKKEMWIELWSSAFNDRRKIFIQETYQPLFKRHWQGRNYVEEMRNDVAMLVIKRPSKYGDLFKDEIQYPLPELMSDIGGLMGLWMGLSIIGLLEIIEFFYFLLFQSCTYQRNELVRNQSNSVEKKTIELINSSIPVDDTFTFKTNISMPGSYDKRYCISNCENHAQLINSYLFPLDDGELERSNRCSHSVISSF